eukprot:TRINITY_DN3838_c0_g1_i9.p1 TRINITY_DN3838_c0_g1~~TRINITY_DN3838_c0_g1_i9.p1  ORF type:complete len:113 (+),score=5.15 TRINITY_DN3838_c0_g1_i9:100-438(+)
MQQTHNLTQMMDKRIEETVEVIEDDQERSTDAHEVFFLGTKNNKGKKYVNLHKLGLSYTPISLLIPSKDEAALSLFKTHVFCLWQYLKCGICLLYTSPSPRDGLLSRMPSSA